MLEPRESDIPALFLVFVVVPIITYFLLGKWSETTKRKERICLVSSGATEEALRVDDMAVGSIMPVIHLPNGIRQCARCFAAAATRCSQCKAVWYCSGRCQIVHWRQVHKLECQQLGQDFQRASLKRVSTEGSRDQCTSKETGTLIASLRDSSRTPDGTVFNSSEDVSGGGFSVPNSSQPPEDSYLREGDFSLSEMHANIHDDLRGALHQSDMVERERESLNACDGGNSFGILNSSTTAVNGTNAHETGTASRKDYSSQKRTCSSDETKGSNCSSERINKRSSKSRITSQTNGTELHKHPKSRMKVSKEPLPSDVDVKVQAAKESRIATIRDDIPLQENNRVANQGLMRMMGMPKSIKVDHYQQIEDSTVKKRKVKMIFPYEEFVKCFQYEVFNVIPRGLVNCGNSCYANAVLQCLACTKPLIIYLLRHSHSRAGCTKDWCLMCELEQLVMMLRQSGGPLSPVNILMYIRSLNTQIGDGSQEDAHEFLRLLVASMQLICLEGFGGENVVDPRLQDTTFIQHTFGGCLRSKVKCSSCHHVSERDEKMMDLTLEIYGWVESLEDALTQFTSSEDLDGDNMYRCARCAAYVRARKQLNIKEAPNILTIVLKRFQEGNYGKINKCITFPEMLDMIPFMTGTDDIPPLYMLYAVVVHLDTSNASFSGHYISYVKDLQGNWFRVDDTEVHPVELSHVMSERAYILFYMRSYPRPVRSPSGRPSRHQTKSQKPLKPEESDAGPNIIPREPNPNHMFEENLDPTSLSRGILLRENRTWPSSSKNYAEFSDATSSDWSHFTSSDDSSFTTESTRDSFSTDIPLSSIFQSLYPAESASRRTVSCSVFPGSEALTRFAREERGLMNVNYGGEPRNGQPQSYVNCTI